MKNLKAGSGEKVFDQAYKKHGLKPAIKDPKSGKVYTGGPGDVHKKIYNQIVKENPAIESVIRMELFKDNTGKYSPYIGFEKPDGTFIPRKEAEDTVGEVHKHKPAPSLMAENPIAYFHLLGDLEPAAVCARLREVAYSMKLAAVILDKDELHSIKQGLSNFVHKAENFAPTEDKPLALSPTGIANINKIPPAAAPIFRHKKDLVDIFDALDRVIDLAAKSEEKGTGHIYFYRELRNDPRWIPSHLDNLKDRKTGEFLDNQRARYVAEKSVEALDIDMPSREDIEKHERGTVTMEEYRKMQELGVMPL